MKTILITGGSDGIGKAVAAQLAPNNKVIILSPHEDKLRQVAEELNCEYKVCDVRDYAQVEKTVSEIGAIDCLINNAGLWIQGPLEDNNPQRIHEVLEVNTLGMINCAKAVVPGMKQQKSGLIINVISQAGLYAREFRTVYAASKWAITGFTKGLQAELPKFGIAVTGLYPGKINTALFDKAGTSTDMSNSLDAAEVAKTVEFIVNLSPNTFIPELGVKHLQG